MFDSQDDCILHVCTFMPPVAKLQGPRRKAEEGQHGMNFLSKEHRRSMSMVSIQIYTVFYQAEH
jgi:hypothetical protein